MKRFFYILVNIAIGIIGIVFFNCYYLIRDIFASLDLNTIWATLACIITTLEALFGISILCIGIHGLVYQITGFSLINFGLKKFGIEETDN